MCLLAPRKTFRMAYLATLVLVCMGALMVISRSGDALSADQTRNDFLRWFSASNLNAWRWSEIQKPPLAYSRAALARTTLQRILNSTYPITVNTSFGGIAFVPPCLASKGRVIESTSSLLVATALTRADNITLRKHNLWPYFNGLFVVSSRGFIPRYSYLVDDAKYREEDFYVGSTRIPNWPLFQMQDYNRIESPCRRNETSCWVGSGRISAIPFHGTILLELLLQLQRRRHDENSKPVASYAGLTQTELHQMTLYWNRIFDYHDYLHEVVMRGCNNNTQIPCYNILHPWESLLGAPSSPTWDVALKPTIERMAISNWTLPFEVPSQIRQSYDYSETSFKGMLYLNQCLATQIGLMDAHHYPYEFEGDAIRHENLLLEACQFAMLDVGYASALAQADKDLQTVGLWLSAQGAGDHLSASSSWATQLARVENWNRQNENVMKLLWDSEEETFQSRYAVPGINISEHPFPTMHHVQKPSVNNLMVFWYDWHLQPCVRDSVTQRDTALQAEDLDQHLQEMAMQLLRHTGKNAFDCSDSYPILSAGCNNTTPSNFIDPRWNYFVGLGLSRNKDTFSPFAQYLNNKTIKLVCSVGSANDDDDAPLSSSCAQNLTRFQEAYPAILPHDENFDLDECGTTSTSTASILYHLLVDDFAFTSESPIPPIRNSWVITLITAELMIAFAVGVTCVLLSLNIVRRENRLQAMNELASFREDEASHVRLMQEVEGLTNRDEEESWEHQ